MQKQTPLISVIMPLYNAERFVGESIENVLRQTVGDFELIVIDDASTDASAEIARAYAAKDNRIVLMHNEHKSGAARTRNRALDAARGKFITFMDADDLCSPERFAKQLAFFERHPQTDICGSYYTMFGTRGGENDELKIQVPLTHEEIQYQLFFGCPFGMSSVMLRSEPFKRTGIRFRECMAEDYQLWVDLSEHLRMANIPEYLTFYRRWEDQISTRQLDRQTLSAQLTQQEQLARKLGVRLSDDEARIFTRFSLRTGEVKKRELASYRRILTRLYKAGIRHSHDPKLLKRQLMRRYKMACGLFYPSWRVWIHKRLFLVRLLAS